jgi:predicted RNA binding protein YcfA (HicA-like mRNA interferase family)
VSYFDIFNFPGLGASRNATSVSIDFYGPCNEWKDARPKQFYCLRRSDGNAVENPRGLRPPYACYRDIVKRLKALGMEFHRQAAGSHEIWFNPTTHRYTTIPNHPGDMPEGTLRAIQASWDRAGGASTGEVIC